MTAILTNVLINVRRHAIGRPSQRLLALMAKYWLRSGAVVALAQWNMKNASERRIKCTATFWIGVHLLQCHDLGVLGSI